MAESELAGGAGRYEASPDAGNHFAFIRTRLALERTMMAWVRTAVALIGFGFTIVQFFERLGRWRGRPAAQPLGPRYVGLGLIATAFSCSRSRPGNTTGRSATCEPSFTRSPAADSDPSTRPRMSS